MKITRKRLALAILSAGFLTVYGCGDNSMPASTVTPASTTFSGTSAFGAPFAGASVVVTDATGATAGTATTADDGSYTLSFNPTSFTAPFVVTVKGSMGNSEETLVSVQPTSSSSTVNITPITHAIAALMSGTGNPLDLVANIATDKSNITTVNVASVERGFRDALAGNITAMGLDPATVNLMSTTFNARLDKLLDNVKVEVTPTGDIKMSTSAGSSQDDLASSSNAPAAAKVVELAKGIRPTAALAVNLPAAGAGETPIGIEAIEASRVALNACFALPATTRYNLSTNTYALQCDNLVTTNYKHDGRVAAQEFGSTAGLIGDSGNTGMVFQKPEILRQLSATPGNERLVVRLSAKRIDGQMRELTTVAENNPIGYPNSGFKLVGNQREYETLVNGTANKRTVANDTTKNRLETGINVFVGKPADNSISSVVVTGPGLPGNAVGTGGITLKPKTGCDFLAIADNNGATPSCASIYRVRSTLTDGVTPFTPTSNTFLFKSPQLTDDEIQTIKPLDLYKFVITKSDATTLTYWNRLRSRPLTVAELLQVRFVDFTPATKALLTTATMYNGGAAPTVSWTVPTNAPRPFKAMFFHLNGSDIVGVPFTSASAAIPCTSNTDCASVNNGTYVSNMSSSSNSFVIQTVSRNRFDTQIFSSITR